MSATKYQMSRTEKRIFILISVLLGLAICFIVFYHLKDIRFYDPKGTPCGLKMYFHLYCPGCGGTRAIDAFLHGHFLHSFLLQPLITYLFIYFMSYYVPSLLLCLGIRKRKINYKFYLYVLWGMLALIIIFFFARNLLMIFGGYDYIGECIRFWQ